MQKKYFTTILGTFEPDVADMVSIDDWPSYSLCSPFASGFGSRAEAGKLRQDMARRCS